MSTKICRGILDWESGTCHFDSTYKAALAELDALEAKCKAHVWDMKYMDGLLLNAVHAKQKLQAKCDAQGKEIEGLKVALKDACQGDFS